MGGLRATLVYRDGILDATFLVKTSNITKGGLAVLFVLRLSNSSSHEAQVVIS